jgi:predicted nucleotidyltransferase
MLKVHQKIIKEVIAERKKDPKVVSILLFGSLARGTAHKDSDVDIEIIYDGGQYLDFDEEMYGIKVDYEVWPKKDLLERVRKKPFTSYPYLSEKILYDPTGFAKEMKKRLKKYFRENPEALNVWKKWENNYLKAKAKGEEIQDVMEFYAELDKRFSKNN